MLYLYPDDIVEFHRRARANGLALPDPEVTFYGMTECRIDDPDGNRPWIGQAGQSRVRGLVRAAWAERAPRSLLEAAPD